VRSAALEDIADLNPELRETLRDQDRVAFIPMAAVDAEAATMDDSASRPYSEVKKGYTSFLDGDVLVAKITPCFENGKIVQAQLALRIGFGSTEFHVVRPHPDEADARYVLHFLRQQTIRLEGERKMTGSAGQRRVPEHFLAGLRIPLPSLSEQRRIATVLDKAEALRAKRRAALAKLDTLTQAIFLDMFGDPASNPKGWPMAVVADVADVQGGLQVTTARKSHPLEVPYIRVANVFRGVLDLREIKTIRATEGEITRTLLVKDDLLVVEGHGNPDEIGRAALWDGSVPSCIHQNHLIRVRFDHGRVVPLYASEYLNSPGGRRHLVREGKTTSGLNTISVSQVRGTPLAVPPMDLQHAFDKRLTQLGGLRASQNRSRDELNLLFSSLQHRAFRGEL
jgi:type I restriction enzyme, S subunit